jgi:riboflavin transporter FmnP
MVVLRTFNKYIFECLLSAPINYSPSSITWGFLIFTGSYLICKTLFAARWFQKGERKMKKFNVKALVSMGMLSSLAYVLMLLNFPIPPFPSFLKIDFSDLPALVAALIYGPVGGVIVEFLKNVLDYFTTGNETGVPIGHISNFVAGLLFILPTYFIYQKLKTKKGMTFALIIGTVTMAALMSLLNYFVFLPAYTWFLNAEAMTSSALKDTIVMGVLPFNIVKGIFMSIVFMLVFAKLHSWIGKQASLKSV